MKKEITQEEYDILSSQLRKLEKRHQSFRQSHIDANNEGDQRECDAWYLTDRLSKQNVILMKEIDEFLFGSKIMLKIKTDVIGYGSKVKLDIDGNIKEYVFCHSIMLRFIDNGISDTSVIGKDIQGKKKGYTSQVYLEDGRRVSVKVVDVI